ncbi:MAG TPA: hypothetical protein VHT04_16555 [Stellaceae bacterium]|nr:hypothetical protein [Stellaceae bacterium]
MSRAPSIDLGRNGKAAELLTPVAPQAHPEGPSLPETVMELLSTLAGIVGVMLMVFALVRLII